MITPIILFLVGLVLLIKGGDWFVDGATGIAHKFHVPDLLIGATVVSIGTTLPEVMVSATSAVSGHGEIAYGNAIGSIICNTALIAAISIAVKPSRVDKKTLTIPVIFFHVLHRRPQPPVHHRSTDHRQLCTVIINKLIIKMRACIKVIQKFGMTFLKNRTYIDLEFARNSPKRK